jgi:hypothetical protein
MCCGYPEGLFIFVSCHSTWSPQQYILKNQEISNHVALVPHNDAYKFKLPKFFVTKFILYSLSLLLNYLDNLSWPANFLYINTMQAPGWSCSGLQNGPNHIYAGLQVGFLKSLMILSFCAV